MTTANSGSDTSQPFAFTVDTHLFRELGEYLVGRNSTALIELVKNAYDADAKQVIVHGEDIENPRLGRIILTDDGVGMGSDEFARGFLRIASRSKTEGDRVSLRYGRRFTGAKGVGRLAAHKLARQVEIFSIPDTHARSKKGVHALIDWDQIERYETLEDLVDIPFVEEVPRGRATPGTRIELRSLRSNWSEGERRRFLREVTSFQPPSALTEALPKAIAQRALLFARPDIRVRTSDDPGFKVLMSGVFEQGDEFWPHLYDIASWVIEIDASRRKVRYEIAPTPRTLKEHPDATNRFFETAHPDTRHGPFFQARIVVREGRLNLPRPTVEAHSGIRIYLEGFRVLPYGERGDDWLSLNSDATSRAPVGLATLTESGIATDEASEREELLMLPNLNYHGAVFLTEDGARHLRLLVNREGFIPDQGFDTLRGLVRLGIDLSTRVRARFKEAARQERARSRTSPRPPGPTSPATGGSGQGEEGPPSRSEELTAALSALEDRLSQARKNLDEGNIRGATRALDEAGPIVTGAASLHQKLISEEALLRVLASVGLQTSGVVHELGGLAITSRDLAEAVSTLRGEATLDARSRRRLAPVERALRDLQHAIERQAAYLTDVVSAEARRRRKRQSIAASFDAAVRLVEHLAEQRNVTILNSVPPELRTPPMFPAEVTSVFANLLTNALKAAGRGGRIRARGNSRNGAVTVTIENSGVAVDLAEAENWFRPFESTTVEIDPVLGQGMGLGLTITRRLLEEYRASVAFVKPSPGYSTAVEIRFPL